MARIRGAQSIRKFFVSAAVTLIYDLPFQACFFFHGGL